MTKTFPKRGVPRTRDAELHVLSGRGRSGSRFFALAWTEGRLRAGSPSAYRRCRGSR